MMMSHRFEPVFRLVELFHEVSVVERLVEDHLLQANGQPLQVFVQVDQGGVHLKNNKENQSSKVIRHRPSLIEKGCQVALEFWREN